MSHMTWYAYLHENGNTQVCRFFSERSYEDDSCSPFIRRITPVFKAMTEAEAREIGAKMLAEGVNV